jgi:hypothetical protein
MMTRAGNSIFFTTTNPHPSIDIHAYTGKSWYIR